MLNTKYLTKRTILQGVVGWWDLFAILCKFMLENFTLEVSILYVDTANEDCLQVTYICWPRAEVLKRAKLPTGPDCSEAANLVKSLKATKWLTWLKA